jgi:hypothetical protein
VFPRGRRRGGLADRWAGHDSARLPAPRGQRLRNSAALTLVGVLGGSPDAPASRAVSRRRHGQGAMGTSPGRFAVELPQAVDAGFER